MSAPTYQVIGVPKVTAALDRMADQAANVSAPAAEVVIIGRQAARQAAPVRTGALAAAITTQSDGVGGELVLAIPYGPAQEFGTRYVTAQRFMRAGYDAMAEAAPAIFDRHVQGAVDTAQKG